MAGRNARFLLWVGPNAPCTLSWRLVGCLLPRGPRARAEVSCKRREGGRFDFRLRIRPGRHAALANNRAPARPATILQACRRFGTNNCAGCARSGVARRRSLCWSSRRLRGERPFPRAWKEVHAPRVLPMDGFGLAQRLQQKPEVLAIGSHLALMHGVDAF